MMAQLTPDVLLLRGRTCTDILSKTPRVCPRCEHIAYWFRNVEGRTTCINCTERA